MKFPKSNEAIAYKKLRLAGGLSGTEAAAILGITAETISRRENGKTPITTEAWIAMEHVTEEALQTIWSRLAWQQGPQARTIEVEEIQAVADQPTKPAQPERIQPVPEAEPRIVQTAGKHSPMRGERTTKPKRKKRR